MWSETRYVIFIMYSTIDSLVLYREKSECIFNECFVERRSKRDSRLSYVPSVRHSVPTEVPFYLSCPVDSHHATYRWKHGNKSTTCQLTQSECLLLIPSMTSEDYGSYKCISHERDYTRIVKEYYLDPEHVADSAFNLKCTMANLIMVAIYLF